ncbi:MAG: hypothetical protein ABRQ30_02040 [Smithellaceae bacterium]|jgi:hypothetical protein
MKTDEALQDINYYEGEKRACYALNDEGKYIIVPGSNLYLALQQ